MTKKIDWMYDRRSCTTCKKTRGYLESVGGAVGASEESTKVKYSPEQALELLGKAEKLISIKGKKVIVVDLKKDRPDSETLLSYIMGPTGNLRAPTLRVGKTIVVGFNEDAYKEVLGA